MNVIVFRGPAGAGESTVATAVQQAREHPTSRLDTDVLNWQFVPGEPNKHVVFEVLQQIIATFLAHGNHVVIAGTIPTTEVAGALAAIRTAARFHRHRYREFFCNGPLSTCVDRASGRARKVTPADIELWWHESRDDLAAITSETTVLDMTLALE